MLLILLTLITTVDTLPMKEKDAVAHKGHHYFGSWHCFRYFSVTFRFLLLLLLLCCYLLLLLLFFFFFFCYFFVTFLLLNLLFFCYLFCHFFCFFFCYFFVTYFATFSATYFANILLFFANNFTIFSTFDVRQVFLLHNNVTQTIQPRW